MPSRSATGAPGMSTVQVLSSPTAPPLDRRSHAASCRHSAVQEGLRARGLRSVTPELLVSEGPTQLALLRAELDILFKAFPPRWALGDRARTQLQCAQFGLVIQARTATPYLFGQSGSRRDLSPCGSDSCSHRRDFRSVPLRLPTRRLGGTIFLAMS